MTCRLQHLPSLMKGGHFIRTCTCLGPLSLTLPLWLVLRVMESHSVVSYNASGYQHQNPLTFQLSSSPFLKCLPDSSVHLQRDRSFTKATQFTQESERKDSISRSGKGSGQNTSPKAGNDSGLVLFCSSWGTGQSIYVLWPLVPYLPIKWRRWVMSALTQLQNTGETEPIISFR